MAKCDLYQASEKVAEELPEGFEIALNLEVGYSGVELRQNSREIDFKGALDGESLANQVLIALEKAKELDNIE